MRSNLERRIQAIGKGKVLAALSCAGVLLSAAVSRADVLCVNTDGSGGCFTSVAVAVDAAGPLDQVEIAPGTYVEPIIPVSYVRKRVRGAGVGVTTIQWSGNFGFDVSGVGGRLDLSDVTVDGPAGGAAVRVGFTGRLELARVELTGAMQGIGVSGGGGGNRTTVTDSTIHSNAEVGIVAADRVRITRSLVHSNGSYGMRTFGRRGITVEDSTFSNNTDAAIYAFGGGSTTVRNSTIVGSSALEGGALRVGGTRVKIEASILSDDAGAVPGLADVSNSGTLISRGFNLVKDGVSGTPAKGKTALDLVGVDPLLAPLGANGGPTLTHALAPGSPALEAVAVTRTCRRSDQRGQAREPAPCDIGAFEAP